MKFRITSPRGLRVAGFALVSVFLAGQAWSATDCSKINSSALTEADIAAAKSTRSLVKLAQDRAALAYDSATPNQTLVSQSVAKDLVGALASVNYLNDVALANQLPAGLAKACEAIESGQVPDDVKRMAFSAAGLDPKIPLSEAERIAQEAGKFPSSRDEFGKGDKIILRAHTPLFVPTDHSNGCSIVKLGPPGNGLCMAPAGSILRIDTPVSPDGKVRVRFKCVPGMQAAIQSIMGTGKPARMSVGPKSEQNPEQRTVETNSDKLIIGGLAKLSPCDGFFASRNGAASIGELKDLHTGVDGVAQVGPEYEVDISKLAGYGRHQFGVAYGALVVPYKFFPSDKSFSSTATVAAFIGYSFSYDAVQLTPVLMAGLSTVPVSSLDENNELTTSNKSAVSAAFGLVATFTRTGMFQVGLLYGKDWTGEDSGYENSGKGWFAVSVGVDVTK